MCWFFFPPLSSLAWKENHPPASSINWPLVWLFHHFPFSRSRRSPPHGASHSDGWMCRRWGVLTLLSLPSTHCSDSPAPKGEDQLQSAFALPSRRQSSLLRSTSGRLSLYFSWLADAAGDDGCVAGRGLWEKMREARQVQKFQFQWELIQAWPTFPLSQFRAARSHMHSILYVNYDHACFHILCMIIWKLVIV